MQHASRITRHTNLTEYYAKRAAEYEAIYAKPERQADLEAVATFLQEIFTGRTFRFRSYPFLSGNSIL
ncbi:MAG: hypothetical protein DYG98_13775 [Haliscomenobacteraceae bacterium CHB4]|nr:hypothetical protein [Haliscomenobacteraceae bacterium CHB4]